MTIVEENTFGLRFESFEEAVAATSAVIDTIGEAHPLVCAERWQDLTYPGLRQESIRIDEGEEPRVFEGDEAVVIIRALETSANHQGSSIYQPIAERMLVKAGLKRPPADYSSREEAHFYSAEDLGTNEYTPEDAERAQGSHRPRSPISQKAAAEIVAHEVTGEVSSQEEPKPSKLARVERLTHHLVEKVAHVLPIHLADTEPLEVVGFEDVVTVRRAVVFAAAETEKDPDPELLDELDADIKKATLDPEAAIVLTGKQAAKARKALEIVAQEGPDGEPKDEAAAWLLAHEHEPEAYAA